MPYLDDVCSSIASHYFMMSSSSSNIIHTVFINRFSHKNPYHLSAQSHPSVPLAHIIFKKITGLRGSNLGNNTHNNTDDYFGEERPMRRVKTRIAASKIVLYRLSLGNDH